MKEVSLIGNIGSDAIIKEAKGFHFLTFSLAVNENAKDGKENTTWFNCSLSGSKTHLEKLNQWFLKGKKVYLSGDFKYRLYNDVIYTDVNVLNFKLI